MSLIVAAGILKNIKTGRYHPIVYADAPLPGGFGQSNPQRVKSQGHHTNGFDELVDVKEYFNSHPQLSNVIINDEDLIAWDGEEVPALIGYISHGKLMVGL